VDFISVSRVLCPVLVPVVWSTSYFFSISFFVLCERSNSYSINILIIDRDDHHSQEDPLAVALASLSLLCLDLLSAEQ
jgi:hypothetical protein